MFAVIVNALAVVGGSIVGLLGAGKITEKYKNIIFISIGSITLVIGLGMAVKTEETLILILSLVLGGFAGTAIDIDGKILRLGELISSKTKNKDKGFAAGFLNASVLFCVGAMTIVGSIKAGIEKDYTLIFTKSVMDGFMAVILTSVFGIGVMFSALVILLYQGGLTLLAGLLAPLIDELVINELSAYGGILVMMIGFNLLELKEVRTANFLPGMITVILFVYLKIIIAPLTGNLF